jgi:hypothetical protein
MLVDARRGVTLGVPAHPSPLGVPPHAPSGPLPERRLHLGDRPLFEHSFWCGTCPALFERVGEPMADDMNVARDVLTSGLSTIDDAVLTAYSRLLQESTYTGTRYYRSFETSVDPHAQLYETIVPMVPPAWNDADQVAVYEARTAGRPTAVAYSVLDVCAPAVSEGWDYHSHWLLNHFLLDGHHKVHAAARAAHPVRLLALIDEAASLATPAEFELLIAARQRSRSSRYPGRRPRV